MADARIDTASKKPSVAIVGLGQMGLGYDLNLNSKQHVYTHAKALSMHSAFRLVGAVDSDEIKRKTFSEVYDAPGYASLSDLFAHVLPDVLVVATSTDSHLKIIQEILSLGMCGLILCEKPLAYVLDEAKQIVDLCESAGVQLLVNYIRRADPGINEIKRRIDSGEIGGPFKAVVWYSKGLLHNGSHFFDLIVFWFGSVRALHIISNGRDLNNGDAEPDFYVELEQGAVIFLSAKEECFSHYTFELIASNGRLRYEQSGQITWQPVVPHASLKEYKTLQLGGELIPSEFDRYQLNVLDHLALLFSGAPHSLCSGKQALENLIVLDQVLKQRTFSEE